MTASESSKHLQSLRPPHSRACVVGLLADAMLGRLARWLRAVGCDAAQLPIETPDTTLVDFARRGSHARRSEAALAAVFVD